MYRLYSALLFVYFLVLLPAVGYARWKHGKSFGNIGERLGSLPEISGDSSQRSIWIHAVSVGEVMSVRPLIHVLRSTCPDHRLVLSTTTVTGQKIAQSFGDEVDAVFYAPFDFDPFVSRTLNAVAPELLIFVDTEIWPNLLRACRRRGVRTVLVNGRLSDRSFKRYRLVKRFMSRVLDDVDHFCVQTEPWADRFVELGADPARVTVTGSLKFDAVGEQNVGFSSGVEETLLDIFSFSKSRTVLIAASTLRGEDEPVLRAFAQVQAAVPDALLVIAPRHPERFDESKACAEEFGYSVHRRSDMPFEEPTDPVVILLDTIGELGCLFQIASAVFVGGSLVRAGGHNLLEPAVFGKAVVVGPHMDNFAEVTERFLKDSAILQIQTPAELTEALVSLMSDPGRRMRLGSRAASVVAANRGSTQRCMSVIAGYVSANATTDGRVLSSQDPGEGRLC